MGVRVLKRPVIEAYLQTFRAREDGRALSKHEEGIAEALEWVLGRLVEGFPDVTKPKKKEPKAKAAPKAKRAKREKRATSSETNGVRHPVLDTGTPDPLVEAHDA